MQDLFDLNYRQWVESNFHIFNSRIGRVGRFEEGENAVCILLFEVGEHNSEAETLFCKYILGTLKNTYEGKITDTDFVAESKEDGTAVLYVGGFEFHFLFMTKDEIGDMPWKEVYNIITLEKDLYRFEIMSYESSSTH